MKKGVWGDTGIWLYTLIGSQSLIAAIERVVRFTALLGPVFVWLAIFSAVYFRVTGARFVRPAARIRIMLSSLIVFTLSGAIWLYAFRLIAFQYSSTDNLNELIQGNGVFLYLLLLLIMLKRHRRRSCDSVTRSEENILHDNHRCSIPADRMASLQQRIIRTCRKIRHHLSWSGFSPRPGPPRDTPRKHPDDPLGDHPDRCCRRARIRDAHPASRPTDTDSICITSSGLKAPRMIQI